MFSVQIIKYKKFIQNTKIYTRMHVQGYIVRYNREQEINIIYPMNEIGERRARHALVKLK